MRFVFALLITIGLAVVAGNLTIPAPLFSAGSFSTATSTPLIVATSSEPQRLHVVGDVMLSRRVETLSDAHGADFPYQRLPAVAPDTVLVGNFEGAAPDRHRHTPDLTFRFSVDQGYLEALAGYGFSRVSLANNHALDSGRQGYQETIDALGASGIIPFGDPSGLATSSVTTVPLFGGLVYLIGINVVTSSPSVSAVQTLIASLPAAPSSLVIAYVHWGTEYESTHSAPQEQLAHTLIDAGVDVVVGHHPHVVQDIARYKQGLIIYSLGNFIFDQYFSQTVQEGLGITFAPIDNQWQLTLVPYTSTDQRSQPRALDQHERAAFLSALADRSDPTLREAISAGTLVWPTP